MTKLFTLGPPGTYGHEAAGLVQKKCGLTGTKIAFEPTNISILTATEESGMFGIAPVENSTHGGVVDVVGHITRKQLPHNLRIIGQIELPVHHCLVAPQNITSVSELTGIISHPQAIGQCAKSIRRWDIRNIEHSTSTAGAAQFVADHPEKKMGAIASRFAAEIYGLKVLEADVNDLPDNTTRFFVFGRETRIAPTGEDKTVLVFETRNAPGALLLALMPIGLLCINMTSIHSISVGGWRYRFYIELDGHEENKRLKVALSLMRMSIKELSVLGSFPK